MSKKKGKVHYDSKESDYGICGIHGETAGDKKLVTCKRCLKAIGDERDPKIVVLAEHRPKPTPEDLEKADKIRGMLHPKQAAAQADNSTKRATSAGRRGGKTFGEAADLIIEGLENPQSNNLFVCLSKTHARTLLWDNPKTGLHVLDRLFNLNLDMNNSKAIATMTNGSLISLHGATKADELEKIRGRGNDKVKVDECASFSPRRLENLVDKCIVPSLADYQGKLTLSGTPGRVCAGPWWDATSIYTYGDNPFKDTEKPKCVAYADRHLYTPEELDQYEWTCHRYNFKDNVAIPDLQEFAYAEKMRKGWEDSHPIWVNEWLGLWILTFGDLVYRYRPEYDWKGGALPEKQAWKYLASCFWDTNGTVGIVVIAYSRKNHSLYHVAERKIPNADTQMVAAALRSLEEDYYFEDIVGARPGDKERLWEDLMEFHNIYVHPVPYSAQNELVILANSDLDRGQVHVLKDSELRSEFLRISWKDPGKRADTTYTDTALSSAFVFGWQFCYHRGPRQVTNEGPRPGTREHYEQIAERELEELSRQEARKLEGDWLETELGDIDSTAIFDENFDY